MTNVIKTCSSSNSVSLNPEAAFMYVDMNSFFASCEQALDAKLQGRPIGVTAGNKYYSVIIAPSKEAKTFGVRTGMRLNEAKQYCPHIVGVPANPVAYRKVHIAFMDILRHYCSPKNVLAKSIDEAAVNLCSYRYVYKDFQALALNIKADLKQAVGPIITCSIGIAPNTFLAKLATDIQKPDGLVQITPDNLDYHLGNLKLTDLPGIASRNARRLELIGIKTPLQMRHTSQGILRRAFGGVAGHYWYCRLNFGEVDFYTNDYRAMSATRTVSPEHRTLPKLQALLVSLCTKLEQRLVKGRVFCRQAGFFIRYANGTSWDTGTHFATPVQDATELRQHIQQKIEEFELERNTRLIHEEVKQMGITISDFVKEDLLQYSLFDDRMRHDKLRKVMYNIKDQWGKYSIRKATEVIEKSEMKDAIGFGSVKDLYQTDDQQLNQFLLEETDE